MKKKKILKVNLPKYIPKNYSKINPIKEFLKRKIRKSARDFYSPSRKISCPFYNSSTHISSINGPKKGKLYCRKKREDDMMKKKKPKIYTHKIISGDTENKINYILVFLSLFTFFFAFFFFEIRITFS